MRDIGRRIQRRRLTRYAESEGLRIPRWVWLAIAAWVFWAGFLSDHGFYRLWRLERSSTHERARLELERREFKSLEQQTRDPQVRLSEAERHLREDDGWSRPSEIIYRIDDPPPSR